MQRPHIDWPRTIAGALAAVAAAVLLSNLGAAGTLIGAAIGSMVISIGTNVGAHGIESTRQRMLEAQAEAARRVSEAQHEIRKALDEVAEPESVDEQRLNEIDDALESAKADLAQDVPTETIPVVAAKRDVPWKRIAVFAASLFVLAMMIITAFELIGGRPISSYTGGGGSGGTTISDSVSGGSSHHTPQTPSPSPTPSATPSASPTSSATPTATATPSATDTPTAPVTPTETPTTPAPSATTTPGPTGLPTP